jgi:GNAT superfamily N-acetyltransferase
MQTLTIRRATLADLAAVDELLAASYPRLLAGDYPPSVIVTALPILSRAQPRLVGSGRYYVVETDDGAVVGAGGWSGGRSGAVGRAEVRHVVTDWRLTRQGIGRAILEQVIRDAKVAGATGLDCLSTRTARGFYAAMGFRELGPVSVTLRPGIEFPAVRMDRPL